MVSNSEVATRFAQGRTKGKSGHMFIEGNAVYSYGHHFPIAMKLSVGRYLLNEDSYSSTTAQHKSLVRDALAGKELICVSTKYLKQAIDLNANEILIVEKDKKLCSKEYLQQAIEVHYKAKGVNTLRIRNRVNKFFEELDSFALLSSI